MSSITDCPQCGRRGCIGYTNAGLEACIYKNCGWVNRPKDKEEKTTKKEGKKMKSKKAQAEIFGLFMLIIIVLGGIGWVKNIIDLTKCDFKAPYKAEVVRVVGLLPMVGAITGWITIEDK
jgi:hypothetical protein